MPPKKENKQLSLSARVEQIEKRIDHFNPEMNRAFDMTKRELMSEVEILDRRLSNFENKQYEKDMKKLSLSDWIMIAYVVVVVIAVVFISLRRLNQHR